MIRGLQKADINRVAEEMQSQGIGRLLLEIQREGLDEATGEKEYVMIWQQKY